MTIPLHPKRPKESRQERFDRVERLRLLRRPQPQSCLFCGFRLTTRPTGLCKRCQKNGHVWSSPGDVNVTTRTGKYVHRAYDYGERFHNRYRVLCSQVPAWHTFAETSSVVDCPGCVAFAQRIRRWEHEAVFRVRPSA